MGHAEYIDHAEDTKHIEPLDHSRRAWRAGQRSGDGDLLVATDMRSGSRPLKVEQAYQEIKRLIITLELSPGSTLDERELMEQLDFGRTPIREAMLRLAHERLIVHSPRRGAWVSELSIIDLRQMLEARDTIEPLIAQRAAERITREDAASLANLIRSGGAAVERDDIEAIVDCDRAFHSALARLGGNVYYASFSHQVHTAMLRYWHVAFRRGDRQVHWQENHQKLLDAILSQDPELAAASAREHVDNFRTRIHALLT